MIYKNNCASIFGLFDGEDAHLFLVIEFGEDGAHAVVAQAAGVDGLEPRVYIFASGQILGVSQKS